MAPLIALIAGTTAARLAGFLGVGHFDSWPNSVGLGVAAMFLLTGIVHFVPSFRSWMIAMVPPRLPAPAMLVTVTGVLELAGAVGVLVPATSTAAGIGLALLLVAMFPANVHAARNGVPMRGRPATPLPPRTAQQVLYIAAALIAAL
ncbi:DoxX family protein [Glycomyces tarimensis]